MPLLRHKVFKEYCMKNILFPFLHKEQQAGYRPHGWIYVGKIHYFFFCAELRINFLG